MNILVTGGAGFIGSHIVDALIKQQHKVIIIDNLSTGQITNLHKGHFIHYNINDPLQEIFDYHKFDYVFHLAAQINLRHSIKEPYEDAYTNIMGSLNILENCVRTKVKRIIFSSTGGAMYNSNATVRESELLPFDEMSIANPQSPYGVSKLTIENYLQIFYKLYGLNFTILRYSNVYGERQNSKSEAGVISIFIKNALQNKDLIIFGDGNQTRDFIYVNDIVNANILAMESNLDGIFNVSSNIQYSINEITNKILLYTNSNSKIKFDLPIVGELLHTRLNADKIKNKGWKYTCDIDQGIKSTIEYFKLYNKL